ncbi:glycosyltransferase family 2 protein [Fodinibius halophilus]|uniref:Glycosyltransferase family 2 protein n=1 Tax=Fodinibius halophilus TaxID=1736908 RepID=A0A6M1TAE6_9BACT|nr:glycosyltransferase family 2 protein [Fodinibius halophilus]NGP87944.1 glycosyltransferase family 2 protein [Fodinibius halophilus]
MPFFSIIIVSWNALDHLKNYFPSVAETDYPNFEIILADNASVDGSKAWVREHYPEVKIAEFDKNYGYCGGNNRAVPHADGDILLFLNNDVRVEPDWLNALAECFEHNPKVAAAQPKMLSDQQPSHFEYAGAAGGFIDQFGYPFCRGRVFDTVEKDEGQYNDDSNIFWASGAALAIRKDIFNELGGFDEDFEFHMEEIDLCWRLWNNGYKVRYCANSTVYHLGGGSLAMGSPRKVYYNYRNNLRMLWKNSSTDTHIWRFVGRYLLDIVAALRSLLGTNWPEFKAIARAHLHFWQSFDKTQHKRARLQQQRTVEDDPKTLLPISIIHKYFIKGTKTFRKFI